MKIRITEPTFFLGQNRKVDDVIENVEVGPVRTQVIPGGLTRIPQFVEMPEEIKEIIQVAAAEVGTVASVLPLPAPSPVEEPVKPANGSFAEATASVLKPPAAAPAPINKTAAMLSALASRRHKLEKSIVDEAIGYGAKLGALEASAPEVFKKAHASLEDRQASLSELDESLKDLAGANNPLSE